MTVESIYNKGRDAEILLVEDNLGDVILLKQAFKKAEVAHNLTVAKDGEIALDILYRRNGYEDAVQPDIILLDLNLPKVDGIQVLGQIKMDDSLKHIPVIMLTSSRAAKDVLRSYNMHVNSYISKPSSLEGFLKVAQTIENFWFQLAIFPDASAVEPNTES